MDVEIKCFATLASFTPEGGHTSVPDACDVGTVMAQLGVPVEEVHIIFVNGVHAEADRSLKPGDRVGLFPAVGGG